MAGPHLLIVESPYYEHIANGLAQGAIAAIEKAGGSYDRLSVPGALEVPGAIAMAEAAVDRGDRTYDGYVALGCVIRGETLHYEIVSNESARGLMDLTIYDGVAVGNGIITVENEEQALVRSDPAQKNKGGDAARAALRMVEIRRELETES